MSDEQAPLTIRLMGMMRYLSAARVQGVTPEQPSPRGVVEKADALEAAFQLGVAIDQAQDEGQLPLDRAAWMASLLMVIRDHLQPLPPGLADDGQTDHATEDLAEMVANLRNAPDPKT